VTEQILTTDAPLGFMAYRDGQCWCDECCRKNARGYGKTEDEAIADLIEQEREEA
jgi:hypothetical protein